jgi:hypothetical protein
MRYIQERTRDVYRTAIASEVIIQSLKECLPRVHVSLNLDNANQFLERRSVWRSGLRSTSSFQKVHALAQSSKEGFETDSCRNIAIALTTGS